MTVITISREVGSRGFEIATCVAESLSFALVDKFTTESIFRQYGMTRFEEVYSTVPNFLDLINADNLLLVSMANEIVEAVAKRGNVVILGRAGFAVLSGCADVLHVRIQAPFSERVQRVTDSEGLANLDVAMERVKQDDEVHRKYVQRFYNKQWDDPSNFNLVINTGSISVDAAVVQIVEAARSLESEPPAQDVPTTASLQVDPVLADAVAKAMTGSRVKARP